MPCMGATGQPPDPESWQGRGWEPERTYHTPRADRSRSSKLAAYKLDSRKAAPVLATSYLGESLNTTGFEDDWRLEKQSTAVQAGEETESLRSSYQRNRPRMPGPPNLGEGDAHAGFDPHRGVYGREAGWTKGYSSRRPPPPNAYAPTRDSSWPHMMNGKVLHGGAQGSQVGKGGFRRVPEHWVPGYKSPDAALVGAEETTAMSTALAARAKADAKNRQARIDQSERERLRGRDVATANQIWSSYAGEPQRKR